MPISASIQPQNLTQQLIAEHLIAGEMIAGHEIQLKVDQLLMQDALSTLTMQALEAMGIDRIAIDLACQYIDHNLLQTDFRNPDDHVYLRSCCARLGIHYSGPGNGISHPTHQEHFAIPGKLLVGTDSHTPANGGVGMLAIGVGSVEGASILAGEPLNIPMPEVMGIHLTGRLADWVSAKDIILTLLQRHSVKGATNRILEYYGAGVTTLSAMDRHVIANMGTELGATSSVFPSDAETQRFLAENGRADDYVARVADDGASYDHHDSIDLSTIVPMIALPSSPDKVVTVREAAGAPLYQAYIGSSANPGYRDFAIAAMMLDGRSIAAGVSFDINPSTRRVLTNLISAGHLNNLLMAGGRLHQTGCNGCNGMGQAPASGKNSLRTVPRNFPGRSGVKDDRVFLCSPETATASAITGVITDPRDLGIAYPQVQTPADWILCGDIEAPLSQATARIVHIERGPNISTIPNILPIANRLQVDVALHLGDNISTDYISPAGARALPYRSNIPKIAELSFDNIDPNYAATWRTNALENQFHAIIAGHNYGQGSSREHAAIAPQYLGLRLAIAKSFARIHWQNLINSAVLPLVFENADDWEKIGAGDRLVIGNIQEMIKQGAVIFDILIENKSINIQARLTASDRQKQIILAGGYINWIKAKQTR
ncbi:MAG: aconitate hydratase [Proteobacteria bacterium]|nr:aconitate hydratase [Pseudomonadota bacterium]MDA1150035.1 aconitate hydratase [Pseudomonadota bacterium]